MAARNGAQIISQNSHSRTVEVGQNKEVTRPPHIDHQPDPEAFGLPTSEAAFKEASRNSHLASADCKWTHSAVYIAAREAGKFELANLPRDKSWPLFERAYSITVRRVLEGEDLSGEIPKALPQKPEARSVDPKVAQQHIERLKRMLKGGK